MLYTLNIKSKTDYGRAYFASIQYLIRYFMRWLLAQGGLLRQFTRLTFARLSQIHLFVRKTSARSSAATWFHGAPSLHLSQTRFQVLKGGEKLSLWFHEALISLYIHTPADGPRWSCTIASLCLPVYSLFSFTRTAGGEQTKATPQPTHTHRGDQLGETLGGGAIRYVLGNITFGI